MRSFRVLPWRAFLVVLLTALWNAPANGQTLLPGDIAITGMNSDRSDSFSFVALVDIPEGELIWFSDNGWRPDGSFRNAESVFLYVAANEIPRGTNIVISTTDGSPNFSTSGDQLFAYQLDALGRPHFIYGFNNSGQAEWQDSAFDAQTSALPANLQNGFTAVALVHCDNVVFTGVSNGTQAEILTHIGNPNNWTCSDTISLNLNLRFTVTGRSNHAPQFGQIFSDTTAVVGREFRYTFRAVDPEGDPVVYGGDMLPPGSAIQLTTGVFSWTPISSNVGTHVFTVRAGDGILASTREVRIRVVLDTAAETAGPEPEITVGTPYPNPASHVVFVPLKTDSPRRETVRLVDMMGRQVALPDVKYDGDGRLRITVSGLSPGLYGVRVGNEPVRLIAVR